jgi:hypothetical protein
MADGIAEQGWPSGRYNQSIARMLTYLLVLTIPALLTSLCALIRSYRLAGALALATGLAYQVNAVQLFRVTAPAKGLRLQFQDVLDIVLLSSQLASYASIPVGVALIVGGIMTFWAARARRRTPRLAP